MYLRSCSLRRPWDLLVFFTEWRGQFQSPKVICYGLRAVLWFDMEGGSAPHGCLLTAVISTLGAPHWAPKWLWWFNPLGGWAPHSALCTVPFPSGMGKRIWLYNSWAEIKLFPKRDQRKGKYLWHIHIYVSLVCQREGCQGNTRTEVVDPLPCHSRTELTEEGWKSIPARYHRRTPCLPTLLTEVALSNRFECWKLKGTWVGSLPRREPRLRQSPPCLETASVRKGRRGIVVGDSLLWGTEGSICRPDPTCKEVCCLPGAHIRDIARKVLGLVCSSDY